jgi:hypothetical protein
MSVQIHVRVPIVKGRPISNTIVSRRQTAIASFLRRRHHIKSRFTNLDRFSHRARAAKYCGLDCNQSE